MFGNKKTKAIEQKQDKTEIDNAKIQMADKTKLLDFVVTEYKENYGSLFTAEDLKEIDADATSLNLLFGIFSELRLIREEIQKKNK